VAWMMYVGDNSDWLVPNGENGTPNTTTKFWVQGAFYYPEANTNYSYILDPNYAYFANYIHSIKTYLCPTDRGTVTVYGQLYPKLRSYSLNAYLGWLGAWDARLSTLYKIFKKHSELPQRLPAGVFLLQDVNPNSICWPYFGVQMEQDDFFNFPNSSHNMGGVISYADGHVERHRWRDQRTITAYSADYHRHQEPSPGNVDLAWLRERTSFSRSSPISFSQHPMRRQTGGARTNGRSASAGRACPSPSRRSDTPTRGRSKP